MNDTINVVVCQIVWYMAWLWQSSQTYEKFNSKDHMKNIMDVSMFLQFFKSNIFKHFKINYIKYWLFPRKLDVMIMINVQF